MDLLVLIDSLTADDGRQVDAIVGDILTRRDVLLSPLLLSTARYDELRRSDNSSPTQLPVDVRIERGDQPVDVLLRQLDRMPVFSGRETLI